MPKTTSTTFLRVGARRGEWAMRSFSLAPTWDMGVPTPREPIQLEMSVKILVDIDWALTGEGGPKIGRRGRMRAHATSTDVATPLRHLGPGDAFCQIQNLRGLRRIEPISLSALPVGLA